MITVLIMIMFLSMIILFIQHPLSFGFILLTQTLSIAIVTGMMSYNYWFSYILFLIMVGGMLILFIYMTSIASNEKFKMSNKLFIILLTMILLISICNFTDPMIEYMNFHNYELNPNKTSNYLSLSKYISFPNNMIMFMVVTYLLVTLIMVVKITKIQYGPLRQKF